MKGRRAAMLVVVSTAPLCWLAMATGPAQASVRDVRSTDQASVDALSPRELVVLRYLASRLTTREIAAELFVSVNTVKTHTKRIYSKLAASSRGEAVAEARRLQLL